MPKIWNKYSQERNIWVSVPISTFMCLWANYIFPRWVCLFCWRKYVDWSWEYINRSQTHECVNWGWGRVIPRKGIYKRNCRCSVDYNKVAKDDLSSLSSWEPDPLIAPRRWRKRRSARSWENAAQDSLCLSHAQAHRSLNSAEVHWLARRISCLFFLRKTLASLR